MCRPKGERQAIMSESYTSLFFGKGAYAHTSVEKMRPTLTDGDASGVEIVVGEILVA